MVLTSETHLIRQARLYDANALTEIYNRYNRPLYVYAMRLLGDEYLAEECLSDTFSRFLQALRQGKGHDKYLRDYLYRIDHNWITDHYRRQPPPVIGLDDSQQADDQPLPDAQAQKNQDRQQVRAALRLLTPEQRQVIMLRYYEGWKISEVADALGRTVPAVKALQHRALINLREILSEEKGERGEA